VELKSLPMPFAAIYEECVVTMDPFALFSDWYQEAQRGALVDPDIMALATSDKQGHPSVRMVLYRGLRAGGFSFFTNYESRKGSELSANPFAAVAFYWAHLGRQVRIEGQVERLSSYESDAYFQQRPVGSQVTAAVSRQSRPLLSDAEFVSELREFERLHEGKPIPRPDVWGGFKLMPARFEFWIHRDDRRHHRTLFEREGEGWNTSRLYP
jgi:pyridoxamine 5'-phosphate oxidase